MMKTSAALIATGLVCWLGAGAHVASAQEIKLPEGLMGLGTEDKEAEVRKEKEKRGLPFDLTGFLEGRVGIRTQSDDHEKSASIGETRLQVNIEKPVDIFTFNLTTDFLLDPVADDYGVDLESGKGLIDLREASVTFSPLDFMDVRAGRQILTWGTGDMIFINDLFPKDWNSFFIGRDDEYLKAPSDALKTAFFFGSFNLDVIYTPRFDHDRYIDGHRISFFDRGMNDLRGRENIVSADLPDDWFSDDELAMRLYRSFGAFETALYYYNGYWKSPGGQNMLTGNVIFPKLQVFGASVRGPVARGIANVEAGYYKSAAGSGSNPLVRNSEFRFLAGYEQEIATELTAAVQYYLERKLDYDSYFASLPPGAIIDDENRHLITLRLTKLLKQQTMTVSLFNFWSPSDKDGYLRFNVSYKITDNMEVEGGGNLFYGAENYTFFGQFQDNSNIYAGLRYNF
ncbi:hypothetical protein [Emcibacter sp.]|uniref:hypothetical protein n=1 Tax=Emcibacter sp. TaxID=1979954 RepID=UPI002AA8C774|nr:hypothetical protein [Emcibacter sp.]